MELKNKEIRKAIRFSGFPQWAIAEKYGLSASHFTTILRKELEDDKKEKIYQAIEELQQENKE